MSSDRQTSAIPHRQHHHTISQLQSYLNQRILGQEGLTTRMLIALLADGHLLVEGAPGLAKTTAIKVLAACIEGEFHRIQFTPDLLPSDLTGTDVFRPEKGDFDFQPGPIFHNFLLADEINRAPAKVQSALLEAMGERQITIGRHTYTLPPVFLVMATQNPIEQEGTYPLPEAQLDRFLMYVRIQYPKSNTEQQILQLARKALASDWGTQLDENAVLDQETLLAIRNELLDIHVSPELEQYMVQLVIASREPQAYGADLTRWLRYGASPRATIAIDRCARAHAWLSARDYVSPEDIHAIAYDVLRHRILLTFEAEAEGIDTDQVISEIISRVAIP